MIKGFDKYDNGFLFLKKNKIPLNTWIHCYVDFYSQLSELILDYDSYDDELTMYTLKSDQWLLKNLLK